MAVAPFKIKSTNSLVNSFELMMGVHQRSHASLQSYRRKGVISFANGDQLDQLGLVFTPQETATKRANLGDIATVDAQVTLPRELTMEEMKPNVSKSVMNPDKEFGFTGNVFGRLTRWEREQVLKDTKTGFHDQLHKILGTSNKSRVMAMFDLAPDPLKLKEEIKKVPGLPYTPPDPSIKLSSRDAEV